MDSTNQAIPRGEQLQRIEESLSESRSGSASPQRTEERMLSDSRLLNNLLKTEKDSQKSCVLLRCSLSRSGLICDQIRAMDFRRRLRQLGFECVGRRGLGRDAGSHG